MHTEIQKKLKQLPHKNETIPFGVYADLVENSSTNTWNGSNRWTGSRRWQRKSWIFFGAYHPEIYVGFAIVDAGYLGKAFCYVYLPATGEMMEHGIDRPFAFDYNFEANLDSHWHLGNYLIKSLKDQLSFDFVGKKFQLSIECKNNQNGLTFLCPSEGKQRPFHSTYKNLLIPSQIQFTKNGRTQTFVDIPGSIDFSKGYPPKETQWNWTSLLGTLEDGRPLGINVVDQFNQNMENAVWIGSEKRLIGPVRYRYKKPLEKSLWELSSLNNDLVITMQPAGSREENINLKFLKSKFTQVYGPMEGKIQLDGQWLKLSGQGVMEEHEAIW